MHSLQKLVFLVAAIMIITKASCPSGWDAFEGKCFMVTSGKFTRSQCETECGPGKLACVTSKAENDFIQTKNSDVGLMIGYTDKEVEGSWVWEGTPHFISTRRGNPLTPPPVSCALATQVQIAAKTLSRIGQLASRIKSERKTALSFWARRILGVSRGVYWVQNGPT